MMPTARGKEKLVETNSHQNSYLNFSNATIALEEVSNMTVVAKCQSPAPGQ